MKISNFLFLVLSIASMNSYAIDVVFDKNQKIAKILEINEIQETYKECSDEYMNGRIYKIEGQYPSISVFLKSTNGKMTTAFDIYLNEMDMVTIKALDTIVFKGGRVKTHVQRCGSGALPYIISIKKTIEK